MREQPHSVSKNWGDGGIYSKWERTLIGWVTIEMLVVLLWALCIIYFNLSIGNPVYCKGFSIFFGINLCTSCIQWPIKVGGHTTIDGNGTESGLLVS